MSPVGSKGGRAVSTSAPGSLKVRDVTTLLIRASSLARCPKPIREDPTRRRRTGLEVVYGQQRGATLRGELDAGSVQSCEIRRRVEVRFLSNHSMPAARWAAQEATNHMHPYSHAGLLLPAHRCGTLYALTTEMRSFCSTATYAGHYAEAHNSASRRTAAASATRSAPSLVQESPTMHGLTCLKIALLSLSTSASAQLVLHSSRAAPPSGYTRQGPAPADQTLALRVALTSNNLAGLEEKLLDISNPASANYAKWLSPSMNLLGLHNISWLMQNSSGELQAYLQPSKDTTVAFTSFAQANGLQVSASPMGDWVQFTTTVEHANALFNASYQTFLHQSTSQMLTRTLSYSLPQALVGHVSTVLPTTSFDAMQSARLVPARKQPVKREIASSCNDTITPSCLLVCHAVLRR
jgi:hypothetical protein